MGNGSLGNLDVNYVICIFKCGQANPSMMGSTMPNVSQRGMLSACLPGYPW